MHPIMIMMSSHVMVTKWTPNRRQSPTPAPPTTHPPPTHPPPWSTVRVRAANFVTTYLTQNSFILRFPGQVLFSNIAPCPASSIEVTSALTLHSVIGGCWHHKTYDWSIFSAVGSNHFGGKFKQQINWWRECLKTKPAFIFLNKWRLHME